MDPIYVRIYMPSAASKVASLVSVCMQRCMAS